MKEVVSKVAKLINVKSFVTITLTIVFSVMCLIGVVDADKMISIYSTVMVFYFGVQKEKQDKEDKS